GLHPLALDGTEEKPRSRSANRRDLAIAFRGIATLVSAGVPLERAVAAIEPLARGPLRESLAAARTGLREGKSLAGALESGPGCSALRRLLLPLVVAVIGAAALVVDRLRRPTVRRRWHALLLDLPLVGPVRLGLATTRVARALGGALGVGMPLLGALESAREAAGDDAVAERLARVRERVSQG